MSRQPIRIICDGDRAGVSGVAADGHDDSGHHRYYGGSALNGGERIVEKRSGARRPRTCVCGF